MTNVNTTGKQPNQTPAPVQLDQEQDNAADQDEQASRKKANAKTEAEAKSVDGMAGQSTESSHDAMSHKKAGSHEGSGGGKKQERHH